MIFSTLLKIAAFASGRTGGTIRTRYERGCRRRGSLHTVCCSRRLSALPVNCLSRVDVRSKNRGGASSSGNSVGGVVHAEQPPPLVVSLVSCTERHGAATRDQTVVSLVMVVRQRAGRTLKPVAGILPFLPPSASADGGAGEDTGSSL